MANKCQLDLVFTLFFLNFSHNPVPRQGPAVCPHHHMAGTGTVSRQSLISPLLQYSSKISSKAKLRHQLSKDDMTITIESFQYLSSPPQCDISATFDSLPDPVQQVLLRFSSLTVCSFLFRKPFRPWLKQRLLWSGDAHTVSFNSNLCNLS